MEKKKKKNAFPEIKISIQNALVTLVTGKNPQRKTHTHR